jgi:hypothetical protein
MTVSANKGNPLSMPEVEAEPEINVVTYDEQQPVEAVPVEHISSTATPPYHPPTNSTANHRQPNHSDYYDDEHLDDGGCECLLCAGDTTIRRISPGFNFSVSLCGDTFIDIRDSNFPPGTKLTLMSVRLCGSTTMLVPPGTRVVVRRLLLCGSRDIHVEDDLERGREQGPPARITLTILCLCGDVRVRSDPNELPQNNKFYDVARH